jgi:hypothetical protein
MILSVLAPVLAEARTILASARHGKEQDRFGHKRVGSDERKKRILTNHDQLIGIANQKLARDLLARVSPNALKKFPGYLNLLIAFNCTCQTFFFQD